VYTQENLLCIHQSPQRSLVHAQHSCACQGPRTQKKRGSRAWGRPSAFVGSLAPGVPGTEHAQECCACTRDLLCIHKRFFCVYTTVLYYYIIIFALARRKNVAFARRNIIAFARRKHNCVC